MSRGRRLPPNYNSAFNRNLWQETHESDHNLHTYDMGFQQNSNSENIAVYRNSVDSRLGYNPNTRYIDETRSNLNDNHTYYRSGMSPNRSRDDRPLHQRMRPNAYEYSGNPTNDPVVNCQSNMSRTNYYQNQDEQYFSEYERNSNVSNFYHGSERGIFNNVASGYHHNDLRENRNRSTETGPSSFSRRKENYMSHRSPSSSNHRERQLVRPRERQLERPRERQLERPRERQLERPRERQLERPRERQLERLRERSRRSSRLERISHNMSSHNRSNVSSTSFEYRKSLKLKRLQNAISRRTAIHNSYKSESDSQSVIKTIKEIKSEAMETRKESNDNPKNETVVSENKKSVKINDKRNALVCPHCNLKYLTSISYTSHLKSARHLRVFRQVALKRNSILAKIRVDQRDAQKRLDAETDDLNISTNYCLLCKLNHQQSEATHEASKYHNKIKEFVIRDCTICELKMKSHVAYESHICSLAHLRKTACSDVSEIVTDGKRCSTEKTNVIDEEDGKADDAIADKSKKELITVGREKVCKVETYYCKLCSVYLPQVNENKLEAVISAHCRKQLHLKHYYRYRRSNKRKRDESLAEKEDLIEENQNESKPVIEDVINGPDESTIKENTCIDGSKENNKHLLLPTDEKLLLKEEPFENVEENFDGIENSESVSIDYIDKLKNEDEFKIRGNICIHANNELANEEQPLIQEKTFDEVVKPIIQEDVNQDESRILNNDYCTDDKQWVDDVNQKLSDILEEAEKTKTEYEQSESERYDRFSNTKQDIEEVKDN